MKKQILAAVLICMVLGSGTALAEDGRAALAHRYLEADPVSAAVEQTLNAILDPQQNGKARDKVRALLENVNLQSIQDAFEKALIRNFTEQELKAAVAFYTSPEGKNVLTKMPTVTREVSPAIQRELFRALLENRAVLEEE